MNTKTTCPDCGTAVGQPHVNECDLELCSNYGGQQISCDCKGHDPQASAWTGELPDTLKMPEQNRPQNPSFFKCSKCGADELDVVRQYVQVTHHEATLSCDCDTADDAAVRCRRSEALYEQTGPLDEAHHVEFESPEMLDDLGTEEEEYEVNCPSCADEADEDCWESEQTDVEATDHELYVRCHGCGREIEFGWSHPERAGRIWPVECADFNPWKCWPEPRYEETWHGKGWLKPIPPKLVADSLGVSVQAVHDLIKSGKLARHPKSKDVATDSFALRQFRKRDEPICMDDDQARHAALRWHPELRERDQIGRLEDEEERHLLIHAVAESLLYGDQRLSSIAKTAEQNGADGHEVRHCLARAFTTGLWKFTHEGEDHDKEVMVQRFSGELQTVCE